FEKWEETQNTVANPSERGADYEAFKQEKANVFMREIEKRYPHIKGKVKSVHVSTPLSYRDYIGGFNGNLYGYIKDSENPLKTFISPKTKLDNLFLTGQSINMHGVLGVTIGAVQTCTEIVGKQYLVDSIHNGISAIEILSESVMSLLFFLVYSRFAYFLRNIDICSSSTDYGLKPRNSQSHNACGFAFFFGR